MTEASTESYKKIISTSVYNDRDVAFSPSTPHVLRLNSALQKYIILAERYPHVGGKNISLED